ncbi:MAG: Do family serine endopeptidase [Alphaproteobacteria bacterium]
MMRPIRFAVPALVLAIASSAAAQPAMRWDGDARRAPETRAEMQMSFAPLVRGAAPAVVNIYTRRVVQSRASPLFADPFFRRFFGDMMIPEGQRRQIQNALGSGVIVDPAGLIVTNLHVIDGADEITVVLNDRREFDAEVAQTDPHTDLALLRLTERVVGLPHLPLGDSDALEVGDLVLAIGNPFGVGQTVTSGIISATARSGIGGGDQGVFIQTDAAINPGNSGGALIDMQGRLIGVPSAILSRSGGSHGIGFAIPSNLVQATIGGATLPGGRTVRPWLGGAGQAVTQDLAHSLGLDRPRGVLLAEVHPGGPLERAGLRVGDVVLSVQGHAVDDPAALRFRVNTQLAGSQADVRFWRGGREYAARFPVETPPETPPRSTTRLEGRHPLDGATAANLSPALVEEMGLEGAPRGVVLTEVGRGSIAGRYGFRPGDVLVSINGREIVRVEDLRRALGRGAERWHLSVRRGGRVMTIQVG